MENIQEYSSDSSEEIEIEREEEEEEEEKLLNGTNFKRSLPPIPQDISDKFIKTPKLPHPEFYDIPNYNNTQEPYSSDMDKYKRLLRHFAYIDVRPTREQYTQITEVNQNLRTLLRIGGYSELAPRLEDLHISKLSVPQPLHISFTTLRDMKKENSQKFDKELTARLAKLEKEHEDSNLLTFDGFDAYPNFDSSAIFFALTLSSSSQKKLSKPFNIVDEVSDKYSVDRKPVPPFAPSIQTLHCSVSRIITPIGYLKDPSTMEKIREAVKDVEIPQGFSIRYKNVKVMKNGQSSVSFPIEAFE